MHASLNPQSWKRREWASLIGIRQEPQSIRSSEGKVAVRFNVSSAKILQAALRTSTASTSTSPHMIEMVNSPLKSASIATAAPSSWWMTTNMSAANATRNAMQRRDSQLRRVQECWSFKYFALTTRARKSKRK